jgi:hypothetical protein
MRSARLLVAALTILFALHGLARAQVTTADIIGRVTDASGAVLPGATVTIEHVATGDVRTQTTTATGDYAFTLLPIGTYTVKIELQGFQTQNARVAIATGDRARVDARLPIGSVSETVQVTAEAPLLQTDTSTVSTLLTEKAVQDLPVNGRNIIRLIQMAPGANEGAVSSTANGTRPDDRRQTSAVSINGIADTQNNQLIDGMDNNERAIGTVSVKPSMDAIAEVRVQTNLYSAETGRTLGGVINLITKSGTNVVHGTAFEFVRNERFDARSFFAATKPANRQHQFGGSLGGPLRTDKTFFFVDYEGFRLDQGVANVVTVPTARMRTGDFSELSTLIYDPLTSPRTPFPGNAIPRDRLDPIALRYLQLYPAPNRAGLANNFALTTLRTQDMDTADVRIDHRFNGENAIFGRYSYNLVNTFTPGACPIVDGVDPNCIVGGIAAGGNFPGPNHSYAHNVLASYTRVFSPTLLAEIKGSYNHPYLSSLPANYGSYLGREFGVPNTNFDDMTSGLPYMFVTDYAHLGDAQAVPLTTQDKTRQVSVAVTKTSGAHTLKVGGGLVMRKFSVLQSISPVGVFTFNSQGTNGPGGVGGNSVASFLLGYPSTVVRAHNPFVPWYHTNEPGLFAQDDWRATSWLTVNLGLRYDIYTPYTEEDDHLANFNPATRQILVAGQNGVSEKAAVETDYTDIAPRLGFSATLPASMVVRGGYGLSYFPGNTASQSYLKNPPFTANYTGTSNVASGLLPNIRTADGLPPLVNNSIDPQVIGGNIIATALDFKANRVQQFNAMIEKEFGGNVVSAGYVGSRGDRIAASTNINLAPAAAGAVQPRRAFASSYPNLGTIQVFMNTNEYKYDAMQIVFQRRYRAGVSFNTHYTLAHAQQLTPAGWDWTLMEWSDAPLDIRHRWVITATYELPWGRSLTGVSGAILSGWQVNAVGFYQTGLPFTVTNSAARTNTGGTDRPNLVGDPVLPSSERTLARWFNTSAFAAQPQFTPGNAPATLMHGPPNRRLDLSLFKDLSLRRDWKLQLRAEVYNVTNTPNFVNPNSSFGSPAFGTISSTGNSIPRQMQFATKLIF